MGARSSHYASHSLKSAKRAERPQGKGESVLATILVDREGRPVEEDAMALSSFAWGLPIALNGDLKALGDWQTSERDLLEALDQRLRRQEENGHAAPLTRSDIDAAHDWLVSRLGIPTELVQRPYFVVRAYQWFKIDEPPEALLLNSFFLQDLDRARQLFRENTAPSNLKRYVGQIAPTERHDLLRDHAAIASALHPSKMPLGRWPAKGRYPLVALQQAAVNLTAHDLKTEGIIAVNGPPGTGKTTLLRDVVAHVVTERARVMASYDDPETAFTNSMQRVKKGNAFLWMYELDERLRGFELVVASSNNKAVENVSAELPGIDAVASDAFPGGYFKTVSDAMLGRNTWGMIAAVLGNASNRSKFRQTFWWDDDRGMSRYLQHACGTQSFITEENESGEKIKRPPVIISAEMPPADKDEALKRWRAARRNFKKAEMAAQRVLKLAQRAAELPEMIAGIESTLPQLKLEISQATNNLANFQNEKGIAESEEAQASQSENVAKRRLVQIRDAKPGFLSRLFHRQRFAAWKNDSLVASEQAEACLRRLKSCQSKRMQIAESVRTEQARLDEASQRLRTLEIERLQYREEFPHLASELGGTFVEGRYFELNHHDRQMAIPWLHGAVARTRDDLFEASMQLHRAFVDAAARPIRHNLGLLMDSFGVRSFGSPEKDRLIPHLWASLFLIVPVVSTTFASVGRMFTNIGIGELGWLLIDEAGQALPQAAVGAVMRSKRAVVVGDPLQIEPVVVLPDQLTEAICREFKIDETRFNAPSASAQTLADGATPYFATFETRTGSRDVGVPLLVHRRCAEPMFGISNAIAYENLMVQAKAKKESSIADILGPSNWMHVEGSGQDKWCPQEGEAVLDLLRRLKASNVEPDLYIVTPFVIVQDRLRELVRSSGVLNDWIDNTGRWPFERIGTVHTVQGREAEAVILVLGAPLAQQTGARNWAGGRPNLLNVAVSRAQEALYVVGNKALWERAGTFSELALRL